MSDAGPVAPDTTDAGPQVRVLGVRHHGPGSARSVVTALEEFAPDALLVEGPADADPLLPLLADPAMVPPVALLAYADDDPHRAAFWPFAVFSPEWQALRWAAAHGVPARFCDSPAAQTLAPSRRVGEPAEEPDDDAPAPGAGDAPDADEPVLVAVRADPLARLAAAAGHDDPERWWDHLVESDLSGRGPFEEITAAMAELRAATPTGESARDQREQRREAQMRSVLRATWAAGHRRVAVVCGAWHAPALTPPLPSAASDARILRGAAKRKVRLTWVPWLHSRLAEESGYGAGVTSPGWYHHLFTAPDRPIERWLTAVAGVLRHHDLPVSSAHVIEAVRLADALATMRGRPLAGLDEVTDATRAVLCDGDEVMLAAVSRELVVGEALGTVPEGAPTVPLEADLRAQARRLRLRPEGGARQLDLDLRREIDLGRSHLLHRLAVLGVEWGTRAVSTTRNLGTFRETWSLQWRPELVVDVVRASTWGTTVATAATAKLVGRDDGPRRDLPDLTDALERAMLAALDDALEPLLRSLDAAAAADGDVTHLMAGLPALARAQRYGDVRGTPAAGLSRLCGVLLVRVVAGLPAAVTGLDDASAASVRDLLDGVHAAVATLDDDAARDRWLDALARVAVRDDVHGLLAGRAVRLLLDAGRWDVERAATALSRALSVGVAAPTKAAWLEGFLSGDGTVLVHDRTLLGLVDDWLCELGGQEFTDVLPLLRRAFGAMPPPQRRAIGDGVSAARRPAAPEVGVADDVIDDEERAARAVAVVARLLGVAG